MSGRRASSRRGGVQSTPGPRPNIKITGKNPPVSTYGGGASSAGRRKTMEQDPPHPPPPPPPVPVSNKRASVDVDLEDSGEEEDEWEKETQRGLKLEEFTNMVREKCVLTDRWMVWDPQYDPAKNQQASLVVEMDKTVEGDLRIKRCVKIYDDRSFQVLIDNVDMTSQFDFLNVNQKLETTYDSDKLIHALITKKVCQGLRTYDPSNPMLGVVNLQIKQRGKLWYAKECTVIVTKAFMGNSCNACMKVRNQIRKCLQTDNRKKSKPAVKQVRSTFGKALYSLLNDFSGRGPIPPSQYARENMVFDEKLGIFINFELHQRLFIAATMPPPPSAFARNRNRKNRRSGRRFPTPTQTYQEGFQYQQYLTDDGQILYVANVVDPVTGELQYQVPTMVEKIEPPDPSEYLTLNDGSIIQISSLQGGQEFQLADGQEYEIIGEAPSSSSAIDPIEILPADNQQIQIIEVDESTMEQIEHPADNMQIAAVDPNDPNLSQLFRAFQNQIQGLAL